MERKWKGALIERELDEMKEREIDVETEIWMTN